MKSEMSAFDVLAVVEEMQALTRGYVDKLFHWDRKNVLLRVNVPGGMGRREVVLQNLKWIFVSKDRPEVPESPSQFAVHARKLLSNARLAAIRQHQFDRIVVFEITREPGYQVIAELFGEGNLLIVSEGKIVNCLFSKTWKDRDVRPGAEYKFPPSRFNPSTASYDDFAAAIRSSKADLVRTLATAANLGGQYGEELCLRAGLDKTRKAKELTDEEILALHAQLIALISSLKGASGGYLAAKEGSAIDVTPVPLKQHEGLAIETFASFSEAIDAFLKRSSSQRERAENPEIQRLARQIETQASAIEALRTEMAEHTRQAESLYMNYQEVTAFLTIFAKVTKGANWEEIARAAKSIPAVMEVRPKEGIVKAKLGESEVWLDYSKGIDENANLLYTKAKETKGKLQRAEEALIASRKDLELRKAKENAAIANEKVEVRPTKKFWFESYKWFITSGGHLALAGRDARTNDQVVKKHLTAEDRFAHADVHGAPSVVIKMGSTATEAELREACEFAISHSKAWNAGAREGSAYWVLPDQVSKTPEAGEFVPRGAFIIRGKRNYEHHLPLRLAIGEIEHEGARKVMCAPVSAMQARSDRYVVIAPGEMPRSRLSAELANRLNVPEEEVSRIIPPGDMEIVERKNFELGA
ncbi:MAG TPA: ribosome rescue protein RqcH [Methanomassiliicoccales archaeon]|nr:ribosome rescue protein RqcH [Methanomassiliicoccales archaeon]